MTAQQIADVINNLLRFDPLDDGQMRQKATGDYVDFEALVEAFGLEINYDRERGPVFHAIPKAAE